MATELRKAYIREWSKKNRDKIREYEKKDKLKHPDRFKEKEVRRRKKPTRIEYMKKYIKERMKNPEVRKKHHIRSRTNKKYGKTPKGYEKHHLDYESPDDFIIIPIELHKLIHTHIYTSKKGLVNVGEKWKKWVH